MNKRPARRARLAALALESDRVLHDLIRPRLELPPQRRTHFLRKRLSIERTAF